jgi:DNA ligase D-like protein (predicted 3'-phosphoesterase)
MASELSEYKKKRNFKETNEPKPELKSSKLRKIFVIQKHHARNLHWDLRLEMNGVLKSWAIPKQPPKTKGIKRLAIQVEDHPLSYKDFEGIIPKGQYGAGKVEIWDKGTYILIEKNSKKIEFEIKGRKLKGKFILLKIDYGKEPKKSWLFFKLN